MMGRDLPQQIWARSGQPFYVIGYKQTTKQILTDKHISIYKGISW